MTEKRQVNIKDFVNDLRSEMADHELMAKYSLSAKGLHRAYQKLIELGSITQDEIDGRTQSVQDTIFFQSMRELPRHYLVIPIPIHEVSGTSHGTGKIRDITQKGLGITGIKASVGDEKIFSIRSDEFVTVPPFSFKAVCRWIKGRDSGDFVGGFEITEISEPGRGHLAELIQDLTFGEN